MKDSIKNRKNRLLALCLSAMMLSSVAGKVSDITMSAVYTDKNPELCLNMFVMQTGYLKRLIEKAQGHNNNSLTDVLLANFKNENFRTYKYKGYLASVSSFLDYYKCSIELAKNDEARNSLIAKKESPIYTRIHNSSPVVYKSTAKVESSIIADECVIEGTVINSVIFRGVKIEKGAVVKDSVLFSGTRVCENASLNCIVTDKDVTVTEGVTLSGNANIPFFVQKNRII